MPESLNADRRQLLQLTAFSVAAAPFTNVAAAAAKMATAADGSPSGRFWFRHLRPDGTLKASALRPLLSARG